jgi:hypothetical protein
MRWRSLCSSSDLHFQTNAVHGGPEGVGDVAVVQVAAVGGSRRGRLARFRDASLWWPRRSIAVGAGARPAAPSASSRALAGVEALPPGMQTPYGSMAFDQRTN